MKMFSRPLRDNVERPDARDSQILLLAHTTKMPAYWRQGRLQLKWIAPLILTSLALGPAEGIQMGHTTSASGPPGHKFKDKVT